MKKFILSLFTIFCASSLFAVLQYEVVTSSNGVQNWIPAQQVTLKITEGGGMWLSNYVSSWYWMPDLSTVANVTADNYGYLDANGERIGANGEVTELTFSDGEHSISTNGYFVGDFNAGDEVNLWITNIAGTSGESLGLVGAPGVESRLVNTVDLLGNVRQNYGFGTGGVEFLAVGTDYNGAPDGQPLPGVLAVLAVGATGFFGAKRLKKDRK